LFCSETFFSFSVIVTIDADVQVLAAPEVMAVSVMCPRDTSVCETWLSYNGSDSSELATVGNSWLQI
jgi:hypothetical protein